MVNKTQELGSREPAIRVVLLPRDTNKHGTIFGGIILSYIDLAGAVEVGKHTTQKIVTVAIKEVVFKEPVMVGEVVSFYSSTTHIGNTSISVHVDVEVDRLADKVHVTSAELTFVCVDETGKPTPIKRT
ncbi:MAG: acyl-CoA thioesterase [Candidatus Melainabacteria bacterium]|nr:acyl-CoA thioesterase [Candidatus Melainabacteria bacterium]